MGSFEIGCKRFGPKVLQENHPYGPGLIFVVILIFSHLHIDEGITNVLSGWILTIGQGEEGIDGPRQAIQDLGTLFKI